LGIQLICIICDRFVEKVSVSLMVSILKQLLETNLQTEMAFSGEENAPESTGGELCNGSSSSEIHSSNNNDNQTSDKADTVAATEQQQSQEIGDCFLNNLGLKKEQGLCNGSTLDLNCNINVAVADDEDDDSPPQADDANNSNSNAAQQQQQQQQLAQLNKAKTADAQCNGLVANVQLPAKRSARTAAKNRSLLDSLLTIKKIKVEEAAASVIAKQQDNSSISKTAAAAAANNNKVDPQAESAVNNNVTGGLFESPLLPNGNAETTVPMNPRSGGAGSSGAGAGAGGKLHGNVYQAEKSFICEICGKAFRFRSNLAEHRSVHTSLKPYVCRFCGKSSRLKGNLTKHILKHHKREQNEFIGKDDIIIKKGKKSVKDPAAVDFLEKSMIILTSEQAALSTTAGQQQQQQQQQQSTQAATTCQSNSGSGGVAAATTVMDECLKAEKYFAPIQEARRSSPMLFNSASLFSNDLVNDHDHQGHPVTGAGGAAAAAATAAAAAAAIGVGGIGAVIEAAKELLPTARNRRITMPATEPTAKKAPTPRQSLFGNAAALEAVSSTLASYGNAFPYSMLFEQRDSSSSSSSSPVTTTLEESLANMGVALANRQRMMTTPAAVPKTFPVSAMNSTRCQICQKHFRKSANLALHLMVKHHFPPPKETMLETVSPPSSSAGTGGGNVVKLNDLLLFAASDHHRDQEVNKRQSPLSVASCGAQRTESPRLFKDAYCNTPSLSTASGHPSSATLASEKLRETVAAATAAAGGCTSALSGDLKEVKTALAQIKQATGDSAKVGALFKNLETRIAHLERQMETSANTLFAVFHMQSEMHNAFNAFKWDMVEQLKNLPRTDLARQSRGRSTPKNTPTTTTTTTTNNNNNSSSS
ncbi:Zinc finger protein, partial [Trichinella papuae]